jgi:hypothetical protein
MTCMSLPLATLAMWKLACCFNWLGNMMEARQP